MMIMIMIIYTMYFSRKLDVIPISYLTTCESQLRIILLYINRYEYIKYINILYEHSV